MRRLSILAAVACSLPACAPAPLPPAASADPRVSLGPGVPVLASAPTLGVLPGGEPELRVTLRNPTDADAALVHRTDWFDAGGRPIASVLSAPRRLVVPARDEVALSAAAPTRAARDLRLRLDLDASQPPP